MEKYMPTVARYRPDSDNSFRARRFVMIRQIIGAIIAEKGFCNILDVGGTPGYWTLLGTDLDWRKLNITLVNLTAPPTNSPNLQSVVGDARNLHQYSDSSFDLVHSNSVIEHVGRWSDMQLMANEVRRLAPRYVVQTPYFWFPIEPHARFPLLHWMPESWRYRILMRRSIGFWRRQPDLGNAVAAVQSAVLLDIGQMRYLFPESKIVIERVFGIPKSITAVR
jgi:SAM-dependent methyltransferase